MKLKPLNSFCLALGLVVMSGCASASTGGDSSDIDSATQCSAATMDWAVAQNAKGATAATDEQLAEAPTWLPQPPACASVSIISTYWVYPNATRSDLDAVLAALREQGAEVPELSLNPDRIVVQGDDYAVSLTSKGVEGAPVQVMIVNADETPGVVD